MLQRVGWPYEVGSPSVADHTSTHCSPATTRKYELANFRNVSNRKSGGNVIHGSYLRVVIAFAANSKGAFACPSRGSGIDAAGELRMRTVRRTAEAAPVVEAEAGASSNADSAVASSTCTSRSGTLSSRRWGILLCCADDLSLVNHGPDFWSPELLS